MPRPIWLQLNLSDNPHGDVLLTFGQTQQTEDSYYFTIDQNVKPGDESSEKAASVMARLLDQWLQRLSSEDGCYLPVGFSDQSMTWLHCVAAEETTTVTLGWSEDEGWSVMPSELEERSPAAFNPMEDTQPLELYTPRLLALVRSNAAYLAALAEPAT